MVAAASSPPLSRPAPPSLADVLQRVAAHPDVLCVRAGLIRRFLAGEKSDGFRAEVHAVFAARTGDETGIDAASAWALFALASELSGATATRDGVLRWVLEELDGEPEDSQVKTLETPVAPVWDVDPAGQPGGRS